MFLLRKPRHEKTNNVVNEQVRHKLSYIKHSWKFWLQKVEELYHTCSENKGADQLRIYCGCCSARFAFAYAECWFSHDATPSYIHCRRSLKSYLVYDEKGDNSYSVTLMPCRYLHQRKDTKFAEDFALEEPVTEDHLIASNVSTSKLAFIGETTHVTVNDVIQVKIDMHDGYGHQKTIGGDLIRVWIRDRTNGASAAAHVTDYNNGTYVANVTMLWAGTLEVVASLISPRETIAINFRRRHKCPQTVHDTAVFQHPKEDITEETLCNTEPFIPGYDVICNLTLENYGHAWYCGKPRNHRLLCNDWSVINDKNMWNYRLEQFFLNSEEKILLNVENKAAIFPEILKITVEEESKCALEQPATKCDDVSLNSTWNRLSPIGYFYRNKWTNTECRGPQNDAYLAKCLSNATVLLIGDSTLRQFHAGIQRKLPCVFITDSWSEAGKHRPVTCYNNTLNFTLTWAPHGLPFSTKGTPRQYLRPISTYLDQIGTKDSNYIIVIHTYAHLLSYHSSVFRNLMKTVRKSVARLLARNSNVKIVIKGPHSWAFEKADYQTMWMIDMYAKVYQDIIHEEFRMLQDKVMYLDCLDMTIGDENDHIHASDNTVEQMIDQMFYHICPY